MKTNSALQVLYDGRLVGTLAMTAIIKRHFNMAKSGWNMDSRSVHFHFR